MKEIIIIVITVLFSTGLFVNSSAQSFEQVDTQTLPTSRPDKEIISSFDVQASGNLTQVLSKESNTRTIDQGSYKNVPIQIKQQSLLLPNGKTVDLSENEIFIGASNSSFFTEKNNFETYDREINIYKIGSDKIQKIKSLPTDSEGKTTTLENGILIVSDEYEGYGTKVDIYSGQGNLLLSYKPYDSGFKHAVFTSYQDFIFGCFESNDEASLKIIKFSTLTNKKEYETIILPILWTTNYTFLVEIQKVLLPLRSQIKRTKALLRSNLLGINLTRWNEANVTVGLFLTTILSVFMP